MVVDADSTFTFILTNARGEAVDITGDSVKLTVRDVKGGTLKLQKTNGPGAHDDPQNGKTSFTITRTDITATPADETFFWVYEIRRIDAGTSQEHVHLEGAFVVEPAVGG